MPELTTEQLESYRKAGVLFPLSVLSSEEVRSFRSAFEALEKHHGGRSQPQQLSQCHLHFRWAYDLATHPQVLDAVETVIGPDILVHSTTIFCKNPGDGRFVSWHQDGYYWGLSEPRLTSAWIALADSTVDNGCLRVVPGSHAGAPIPHAETAVSEHNLLGSGLEVAVRVDESQALDVELLGGEMSLHHVNIVHGSGPNRSEEKRIGFAVRYLAPEVEQRSAHHEVVLARGADRFGHYQHESEVPSADFEQSLARHQAFGHRLREMRRAQGRADG